MINKGIFEKIASAEIVNLGSGPSAYAFDYEAAGINGVNLAMTPSAFALESALVQEYREAFRPGCAVVLAVCPFSFGENRSEGDPSRFARYADVLSEEAVESLSEPYSRALTAYRAKVQAEDPAEASDARLLFPYQSGVDRTEHPSEKVMDERIDSMCVCWKREFGLSDFLDASQADRHESAFVRKRAELCRLISLCQSIGLRPYLFLPPLHPALRARVSDAFFRRFVLDQLDEMPVPVLSYASDPALCEEMFLGPVFLNRDGAAVLTRSVWEKVGKQEE